MHEEYMLRAIELARKGEGSCHPNPKVGAVIVSGGRIIGEGYHARCGELHAERNAIASLTESAEDATMYVTLEPCCHYGKTPPCTQAIIENKIALVVIGSRDPNPLVAGRGVSRLRAAGIEVIEDFMRSECDALNRVFFHFITTGKPYVRLKYAMTADGKIATRTGASKWITGEDARKRVHELRNADMAIMVGIGTVIADDPVLNCRSEGGCDPTRVILDSRLKIPLGSRIVMTADHIDTIIAAAVPDAAKEKQLAEHGVRVMYMPGDDGRVDVKALLDELGREKIDSVLVEGGSTVNMSMLATGYVSEVDMFIAPKIFGGTACSPVGGEGIAVPDEAYGFSFKSVESLGDDMLIVMTPKERLCSREL